MMIHCDGTSDCSELHLATSPFLSLCLGASDDWISAHGNWWKNSEMATVSPKFSRGSINPI